MTRKPVHAPAAQRAEQVLTGRANSVKAASAGHGAAARRPKSDGAVAQCFIKAAIDRKRSGSAETSSPLALEEPPGLGGQPNCPEKLRVSEIKIRYPRASWAVRPCCASPFCRPAQPAYSPPYRQGNRGVCGGLPSRPVPIKPSSPPPRERVWAEGRSLKGGVRVSGPALKPTLTRPARLNAGVHPLPAVRGGGFRRRAMPADEGPFRAGRSPGPSLSEALGIARPGTTRAVGRGDRPAATALDC